MKTAGALAVLALLASACGSTVQYHQTLSGAAGRQQGLGGTSTDVNGRPLTTSPGTGLSPATGPTGTSGHSGTTGTTGSLGPAGGGSTASSLQALGVTATTVNVGVAYAVNAGAANAAIGGGGITTGNEPSDAKAVIDDLNKKGGLLGRRVVPVFFQRDAQSTEPVSAQAQRECDWFTQDHKIFAALLGNGPLDWAEKPCLNKRGVPAITAHIASLDDGDPRLSGDVDVTGMDEAGLITAQLAAIRNQKWLDPWNSTTGAAGTTPAKVGVISYDLTVVNRAVDHLLLPGLAQLGHPVASQDIYRIAVPQATQDDAPAEAAIQNAVLKLRSSNVDHVVVVDNGGAMTLLLSNDLYSQRYFPRLAGTTSNGFQALLSGNDIQPQVLVGMVGAGWEPVIDLPFSDTGATPARTACLKLLRAAGQTFTDANSEAVALGYCDKLSFLRTAVQLAGTASQAAYLGAVDRVGAFASCRGLGSRFRSGRHDGGDLFRDMVFDASSGHVVYAGPTRSVTT